MIPIDGPTAGYAVVRAVHFGSCLLLCGTFIFDRLIVARARGGTRTLIEQSWFSAARTLVVGCLAMALLSAFGWMICVTMAFLDLPFSDAMHVQPLRNVLDQSQFGTLWKWRGGLSLAAAVISLIAFSFRRRTLHSAFVTWLALIASAAYAVSVSRSGHGGEGTTVHQIADAAHLFLGAVWPVGLIPLMVLLVRFSRANPPGTSMMSLIPIVDRFSAVSLITVLLIGVSGVVNSWPLVGEWSNLTTTPYGKTLIVKVSLFLGMILLGAINLFLIRPRLARAVEAGIEPDSRRALRWLRLSVGIEILLGVCVLLAAGLLGALPPATSSCCSVMGE